MGQSCTTGCASFLSKPKTGKNSEVSPPADACKCCSSAPKEKTAAPIAQPSAVNTEIVPVKKESKVQSKEVVPATQMPALPPAQINMDISPVRDGSMRKWTINASTVSMIEEGVMPTDGAKIEFEFLSRSYPQDQENSDPTEGWAFTAGNEPKKLKLTLGDCECCDALEATIAAMKRGETCVVRCGVGGTGDVSAWTDPKLGFGPRESRGIDMLVSLLWIEKEKDVMEMEPEDRAKYASERKDAAGKYFKDERYVAALNKYKLVSEVLSYVDDLKDPKVLNEARVVKRAAKLNEAMCCLKLKDWTGAIKASTEVLNESDGNEKALYRRASAYMKQGEHVSAEVDLKRILADNSENQEARRLLVQCKAEAKESGSDQKDMFAKMLKGARAPPRKS